MHREEGHPLPQRVHTASKYQRWTQGHGGPATHTTVVGGALQAYACSWELFLRGDHLAFLPPAAAFAAVVPWVSTTYGPFGAVVLGESRNTNYARFGLSGGWHATLAQVVDSHNPGPTLRQRPGGASPNMQGDHFQWDGGRLLALPYPLGNNLPVLLCRRPPRCG